MAEQGNYPLSNDDEIGLLDYWRVIWRQRRLVGILFSTSVLAALILSLILPKIYESTATVLAPKEGGTGGLLSALGASGIIQQIPGVSVPSVTPNRDIFISILKSRTIAQKLVEQFKLKDYYKALYLEDAIISLQDATRVSISKEGVISVKVEDRDPKMAAGIANAYTEHLDRLMAQFGTGTAGNQRRFVSEQLAKAEKELKAAEETLRQFQERNRAVLLGDMANSMRLPGARVPQVGLELGRLTRDLRVQEAVYTILTQQLEQAKIGEAQDMPVVQVLDRAVPAVYKSRPKTMLNMALAGVVSLFLGIFIAFFLEYIERQKQQMANSK
ncbi:MAG: hypothetical protein HYY45_20575 [Deltaproteobacteria bacterium]|nr:hypothetical protein [Deltaproteobacteria bacterium]